MVFYAFTPGLADLDIKSGDQVKQGRHGLKVMSRFGANPDRGLPALHGASLLFNLETRATKTLLNARPITDFRIGAAGAIDARTLVRPDSKRGYWWQAQGFWLYIWWHRPSTSCRG